LRDLSQSYIRGVILGAICRVQFTSTIFFFPFPTLYSIVSSLVLREDDQRDVEIASGNARIRIFGLLDFGLSRTSIGEVVHRVRSSVELGLARSWLTRAPLHPRNVPARSCTFKRHHEETVIL